VDTWEDAIYAWVGEKVISNLHQYANWDKKYHNASAFQQKCEFTTAQVLTEALRVPSQYQKRADITRASRIISKSGCVQGRQRRFGKTRTRVWTVPTVSIARFANEICATIDEREEFNRIIDAWE
jgi:hypothetical protein